MKDEVEIRHVPTEAEQVSVVLGAYRSIRGLPRTKVGYVSMPVTSGLRCNTVLREHGARTVAELVEKCGKSAPYELIIKPNCDEGVAFADRVASEHGIIAIAPSVFEAKSLRWTQDGYMSLWYPVIAEFSGRHYMMDGWEYSLGSLKEVGLTLCLQWQWFRSWNLDAAFRRFNLACLKQAAWGSSHEKLMEMKKTVIYDAAGSELRIAIILKMVADAIEAMREQGFCYRQHLSIAKDMADLPILRRDTEPYSALNAEWWTQGQRISRLVKECGAVAA